MLNWIELNCSSTTVIWSRAIFGILSCNKVVMKLYYIQKEKKITSRWHTGSTKGKLSDPWYVSSPSQHKAIKVNTNRCTRCQEYGIFHCMRIWMVSGALFLLTSWKHRMIKHHPTITCTRRHKCTHTQATRGQTLLTVCEPIKPWWPYCDTWPELTKPHKQSHITYIHTGQSSRPLCTYT